MKKVKNSQQGFVIAMLTVTVLTMIFSAILVLFQGAFNEYKNAYYFSRITKAKFLAQSGLEAALVMLKKLSTEQLYSYGIMYSPPILPLGPGCLDEGLESPDCGLVSFSIKEETGKLNVNRIVNFIDGQPSLKNREMLDLLSESMGLSSSMWDSVQDFIDYDDTPEPQGSEKLDYALKKPPRRIKNARLHGVEELLMVDNLDYNTLYADLRDPVERENTSTDFLTEEEKASITDEDYILSNNLTVYLPYDGESNDFVNINTAPYHVILALSEYMTPDAAKAILKDRINRGGRFSQKSDLAGLQELQTRTTGELNLFQEIEGRISTQDAIYRIDVNSRLQDQSASIFAIYDVQNRKLVRYTE